MRDEQVRARELSELLDVYQQEQVAGAFIFTWAGYTYPYSDDPEHNFDTAGYGVVAVLPDGTLRPKAACDMLAARK
ncbi:hypothetical protein LWP59_28215 [Amycolatopsis acidiphila]|uniref:Uncharacterized protein n=1 Tax=Amycolatopsis acidiphila TaxID=715473 RepID=A0A558ADE8_9PSEU|nr:hypothetical protein [Amycolatopsis acidiphila]TVT22292.1 hypothetical protein FNH06_14020 [Amycolatopsis acidiphila]UIJ57992.1 hypothetical protein LWP59_28215 [Amycolatopsis acidiphila]GHG70658.1 hypothetical protein GCM10017788_31990 [Amycolatopsis acidiphila]